MSTDTTATEATAGTIAARQEEVAVPPSAEIDYESELAKVNLELEQTRAEKDNYRKAYLKKSGNQPVEDDNPDKEDIDDRIDRRVQEKFLATKEAQAQQDKDKLIADMAKKLRETTLALKNRSQVTSTSGQGSNQEKPEGKTDNVLSNDQINSLKAKGWDDKKIEEFKKNLKRGSAMPK